MNPLTDPEAVRKHAYLLLQRDAQLSLADCQFYEQEVRLLVESGRSFTAYEVSWEVNGRLIQAGRAWLQHTLTGAAVHILVSLYSGVAGYRSDLVDLGGGRVPRLYYPDETEREQWLAAHLPSSLQARGRRRRIKGKPGRPAKRLALGRFARARRRRKPPMKWGDIRIEWLALHSDNTVTVNVVRSAARRLQARVTRRRPK